MKPLIFLLIVLSGYVMANPFAYNIQKAGYGFDQYDLKGSVTFEIFKQEFRSFPWKDQVGRNTGGAEPTISVENSDAKINLWVSVIGTPEEFAYLVGIVQPKKVKSMFGLGKEKEVQWVTAYILEKPEWVEQVFQLYFEEKTEALNSELSNLPVFLEQEAVN